MTKPKIKHIDRILICGDLYKLTFSNGKSYIGACICGAKKRYDSHKQSAVKGSTTPVHIAWRILGDPTLTVLIKDMRENQLWGAEKDAIKKHKTMLPYGYNSRSGSEKPPGALGYNHTDEAKLKIAKAGREHRLGKKHSAAAKQKNREAHLGKKHTARTKQILRGQQLGRRKSKETRERMSAAQTKRWSFLP